MTIFFTSDQHYYHRRLLEVYCRDTRPFKDIDHMTEGLIERHNAVVKAEDTVINVGDFSMSEKCIPDILKRLNGTQIIIAGNHDRFHHCHGKKAEAAKLRYLDYGFKDVIMEMRIEPFLITHMPYKTFEDERHKDRYAEYRPKDDGGYLICGHIHNQFHIKDRMFNAGVDVNNCTPVSYEAIKEAMGIKL
jgi:calcineurin-like phosphoesterase family protein